MSARNLLTLSITMASLLLLGPSHAHAQRRGGGIFESIGRELLNQAINGPSSSSRSRNQPRSRGTFPNGQPIPPGFQGGAGYSSGSSAPAEAGNTPSQNPFAGVLGQALLNQQRQRTQPRPQYTYQQQQPRPQYTYQQQQQQRPITYYRQPQQTYSQPVTAYKVQPTNYYSQPTTTYYSQPKVANTVQTVPAAQIKVTFPKTEVGNCPFTLLTGSTGYPRNLSPGQMQKLDGASSWSIRYNENGVQRTYRLVAGSNYVFKRTAENYLSLFKRPKEVISEPPVLLESR